jgi:hypothetical protein
VENHLQIGGYQLMARHELTAWEWRAQGRVLIPGSRPVHHIANPDNWFEAFGLFTIDQTIDKRPSNWVIVETAERDKWMAARKSARKSESNKSARSARFAKGNEYRQSEVDKVMSTTAGDDGICHAIKVNNKRCTQPHTKKTDFCINHLKNKRNGKTVLTIFDEV